MRKFYAFIALASAAILFNENLHAQHSVARQWNEALLHAIRHDYARPTVHARNLFHTSVAMYDAWASYTSAADHYFLGDSLGSYFCPFNDTAVAMPANIQAAQEEAISYAAYRILKHRFASSPGASISLAYCDSLFLSMGYNPANTSVSYAQGGAAELGNYIAQEIIAFGLTDNSNEQNSYANIFYTPVNQTLLPVVPGNPNITDPNRWQPLTLQTFIDQSGNVIPIATPQFLSPEWGLVVPFALSDSVRSIKSRNGNNYPLYYNLPAPPLLDTLNPANSEGYKWGFRLVSKWSSHLDTTDGVMWDISPASTGNVSWLPSTIDSLPLFYDEDDGHDYGNGYNINPATGQPYQPQMVKRGDYARVLAEFWADGPDSETPPGHWFTILNYVNDQPQLQRNWRGKGPALNPLEWDIKCYFTLAGAMHDAAVAAWGAKGWYDYLRPISAIRYMADLGQSSDTALPNYHPNGIELDSGFVELVDSNDALVGNNYQHLHKIKVYAWKGPDSISDPLTDMAGVGWILAENWWPYQRPTFVTPPFAGYVSGHSTYSRAAAEVLTLITDDPYFPGGMGEFLAPKNQFLVFEEGPSTDVKLQWATYRDASDQCSLSRIWGGIHPPADDMPGRLMGRKIGIAAFHYARQYWENGIPDLVNLHLSQDTVTDTMQGRQLSMLLFFDQPMDTLVAPQITFPVENPGPSLHQNSALSGWLSGYEYEAVYDVADSNQNLWNIDVQVSGASDDKNVPAPVFTAVNRFHIDMKNPSASFQPSQLLLNDSLAQSGSFNLMASFSEEVDTSAHPQIIFTNDDPTLNSLMVDSLNSGWLDSVSYRFAYQFVDAHEELFNIQFYLRGLTDRQGNEVDSMLQTQLFAIDTRNPNLSLGFSADTIGRAEIGSSGFWVDLNFSEGMDTLQTPVFSFPAENPSASLSHNPAASGWNSAQQYRLVFNVDTSLVHLYDIDLEVDSAYDMAGNKQLINNAADAFSISIPASGISLAENRSFSLAIYPNPLRKGQEILLQFGLPSAGRLQIYDASGALVKEQHLPEAVQQRIATTGLAAGLYNLRIEQAERWFSAKFLIVE